MFRQPTTPLDAWQYGYEELVDQDPDLALLLLAERRYQEAVIPMVAYASCAAPSVLAAGATELGNVTAEGYPGHRYHPGCVNLDQVETLAQSRARAAFGARYANVQPHSGSQANLAVLFSRLAPGDPIMGMDLASGGHLTHGSRASAVGRTFDVRTYGLDPTGRVDYAEAEAVAREHRPKLIFVGASAYPRLFDYARFREIADEVGAVLVADISHIAGLVAARAVPSPIDLAHVTTSSTYKQLGGPRGGLILMGADHARARVGRKSVADALNNGVFPRTQGTLNPQSIAAKARTFDLVDTEDFRSWMSRVRSTADTLAEGLRTRGFALQTDGTDNHMVLADLRSAGITGRQLENGLERAGILANKNAVPGDELPPTVCGGIRFGTNILAQRGWNESDMDMCAELVARVRDAISAGPERASIEIDEIASDVDAFIESARYARNKVFA